MQTLSPDAYPVEADGTTTGERRGDERGRPDWRERMREAGAN